MMEEDRDSALWTIRAMRETWFEPAIVSAGGEILKRLGDGWIVRFHDPVAAIEATIRLQEQLASEDFAKLRIGIHSGEIVAEDGDFYGAGINLATRIEVEAPPGGVMISSDLAAKLPDALAELFRDAGNFRLKNIALPVTLLQWRPTRLGNANRSDEVPTVCVEAFAAAPNDQETTVVADDLRDQLIQRLSRRTGIRVLDDSMGGAGGATYRLRGRVRIAGNRGRVSLSLYLKDSAQPSWTKSYDEDTKDIFAFCDHLVDRADTDLRVQINAFDGDRIAHLKDDELSVSELRSRAATLFYDYSVASWERARSVLERGIALAPRDPMASAMHAEAVVALAQARYEIVPSRVAERLARDLDAAVEASPRSDYIFWARAFFKLYVEEDLDAARADVSRTLAISPVYTHGHELLGLIDLKEDKALDAIRNLTRAIELTDADPILPYRHFLLSISQLCAGDPSAASAAIEKAIQLRPSTRPYHRLRAECCRRCGNVDRAQVSECRADDLADVPSMLALRPPVPNREREVLSVLAPGKV
jgi:adenylate cyclase